MDVRACRQCKRLFNYLNGPNLCASCKAKLEEKFQEVKEYVKEHPLEGIAQVAEANDVSTKQIKRWIREERLEFSSESGGGLDCESCGTMIRSGRLCPKCREKLMGAMKNMYKQESSVVARKHREAERMRFLDR